MEDKKLELEKDAKGERLRALLDHALGQNVPCAEEMSASEKKERLERLMERLEPAGRRPFDDLAGELATVKELLKETVSILRENGVKEREFLERILRLV